MAAAVIYDPLFASFRYVVLAGDVIHPQPFVLRNSAGRVVCDQLRTEDSEAHTGVCRHPSQVLSPCRHRAGCRSRSLNDRQCIQSFIRTLPMSGPDVRLDIIFVDSQNLHGALR